MRIALTIAGSDSSAGAGIQADLKTFAAHGVFGISAITADHRAEHAGRHRRGDPLAADLVTAQIEAVVSDIGRHAAKTGMLANAAIVEAVAAAVDDLEIPFLVVDPVIVASSGDSAAGRRRIAGDEERAAVARACRDAEHSRSGNAVGRRDPNEEDRREAARRIFALGPVYVVITGGTFIPTRIASSILSTTATCSPTTRSTRVAGRHTHGTGCAFSAALTSHLALGRSLHEAVPLAQEYVAGAIRHAPGLGRGAGPMQPLLASR